MSVFDKFLGLMQMDDEDDEDDYYDEYEEDEEEHTSLFSRKSSEDDHKASKQNNNKITPLRSVKKSGSSNMAVSFVKPTSYDDVKDIAEALLDDKIVLLNMEGLDLGLAQRIIDFSSGACYALDGTLQKIGNYNYILTPSSVDLSGDFQDLMNAFDFGGIQTGF